MLVKNNARPFMAEAKPLCNKQLDETRKLLASEDVKNDRKQLNKVQFKFNVLIKATTFLINAARAQFHAWKRNEGIITQRQRRMEKDDGGCAKKEKGDEKDDEDEEGDDEEDGDEKSDEDVVVTGGQDQKMAIFVDDVVDDDDVEFFKSRSSDRGGTKNQKDSSSMLRHLDECEQVLKTNYPKFDKVRAVHLGDILDIVGEDCWGKDAFIMHEYDANEIESLGVGHAFQEKVVWAVPPEGWLHHGQKELSIDTLDGTSNMPKQNCIVGKKHADIITITRPVVCSIPMFFVTRARRQATVMRAASGTVDEAQSDINFLNCGTGPNNLTRGRRKALIDFACNDIAYLFYVDQRSIERQAETATRAQAMVVDERGRTSDAHEVRNVCPINTQNNRNFGSDKRLA